jgi:hypothetical protein
MDLTASRNSVEKRKISSPAWNQTVIPRSLSTIPSELRRKLSSTVMCDRILYSKPSYSKLISVEVRNCYTDNAVVQNGEATEH